MSAAPKPASSSISLRRARIEDREAIWRLHRRSVRKIASSHYAPHEIEAWTTRLTPDAYTAVIQNRQFFVAEMNGRIVGFGQLDRGTAEIEALYVDPSRLRRGVGSTLMAQLEESARAAGLTLLQLHASMNAVPFYERVGFQRVRDMLHPLEPGIELACVLMEKKLEV